MFFVNERKKITLNTISKSFAELYDTCKLKAWSKKRTTDQDNGRLLMVGKAAHELFASKIAERMGETYTMSKVSDPSILFEAQEIVNRVNIDKLVANAEIIGYEMQAEALLPNGMTLIGIFDLVLLVEDEILGPYIQIIDFKTGYIVSKNIDNECIFYAYLAAARFGLPVTFTRLSGRTRDEWGQFFSYEKAMSLLPLIVPFSSEIKRVVENEEEPFPEAGEHCVNCPFLGRCGAKDMDETDVTSLVTRYQLVSAQAEVYKDRLKNFRIENQVAIQTEEFTIDMKESRSKAIANKGIKKNDLITLFSRSGRLGEILDSLDVKLTEDVMAKAAAFGIEFKDSVRRSLSIEARGGENEEVATTEEGEENE